MSRHLPPLSALRAFEAVARLGSVSRAAAELGRTHGAVSKQLRTLADHSGLVLFDKVGTGVRANAAGQALATAVAEGLDRLAEGYGRVLRDARAPELHVACSVTFATGWLAPRLPGFAERCPDVRLRLTMTSAREMRDERDADLVILWDRGAYAPDDQARAIPLAETRFGPVTAPDYPVTRAGDTLSAPRRIVHDHTTRAWDRWCALSGLALETIDTMSFPHTHLCLGAAVAGLGVAIAEQRLAAADIAAGRLAAPAGFTAFPDGFVALPHRSRPLSTQAQAFVAWIGDALAAPA